MNQIERDLTYRLDAVREICGSYGFNSFECQNSIEIWTSQHRVNVLAEQLSSFWSLFIIFLGTVWMITYLLYKFYIYKIRKEELEQNKLKN